MFGKKSLNFKLRAAFGAIALILLITGVLNLVYLNKTVDHYNHVAEINLNNAITLASLDQSANRVLINLLQMGLSDDPDAIKSFDKIIADFLLEFAKQQKIYEAIPFVEGEAELYDKLANSWKVLTNDIVHLRTLAQDPSPEAIVKFTADFTVNLKDHRIAFYEAIHNIIEFQNAEGKKWAAKASEIAEFSRQITYLAIGSGLILAIILALSISSALSKVLSGLAIELSEGANMLAESSVEISNSSANLSSSVQEQAAAIQETSASAQELTAMVAKAEENAIKSYEVSQDSKASAENGKTSVTEVKNAIDDIQVGNEKIVESVNRNNKNIEEIKQVIIDIAEKTKVINEIVFQTKLLSFNASVEAARAGEQGKGFAVVAEEVGNLATMSGNAAQEITNMLSESTTKVENIVRQTQEEMAGIISSTKKSVDNGIRVADNCQSALDEIVSNVNKVDLLVQEIKEASRESTKGIQEITSAMSQLDQTIQINSAAANEAEVASKRLADQATQLSHVSQTLKYTIEGYPS